MSLKCTKVGGHDNAVRSARFTLPAQIKKKWLRRSFCYGLDFHINTRSWPSDSQSLTRRCSNTLSKNSSEGEVRINIAKGLRLRTRSYGYRNRVK